MSDDRPRPDPPARPARRKRFGQHFLADRQALKKIADAVSEGASEGETVVEIGPGRGALTDELVARRHRVVAIEIDRDLVQFLRARYADVATVRIVEGDVLQCDLSREGGGSYRLVGNLPYYITTPIIFHTLQRPRPRCAVFLVQREVADRLTAEPGSEMYGALSVNVQSVAEVELIGRVRAGAFHPPPQVDSAIVRLVPRAIPVVSEAHEESLREFVIAAFGQRRKQMGRALRHIAGVDAERAEGILRRASIDPTRRPETLAPAEFAALHLALRDHAKV